jgi:hypothetical protein
MWSLIFRRQSIIAERRLGNEGTEPGWIDPSTPVCGAGGWAELELSADWCAAWSDILSIGATP